MAAYAKIRINRTNFDLQINFVVFDLFFLPILTNLRQNAHKELVSVQK